MNCKISILVFGIFTLFLISSCGIYSLSFSGASYGDAKTVTIDYFDNRAEIVNPSLSQSFTEKLKDKFISQTPLDLVTLNGDLHFKGEIIGYETMPMGIQAGETAASNRLTITVKVSYTNKTEPKYDFTDTKFSWYADYPATESFISIESQLVEEISDQLVEDIFNKAVVNW